MEASSRVDRCAQRVRFLLAIGFILSVLLGGEKTLGQSSDLSKVKIIFEQEPLERFPRQWTLPETQLEVSPLRSSEFTRTRRILEKALAKYPREIVSPNLQEIVVVETLRFRGVSASGTNSLDKVFLANAGSKKGFSDQWIERVFHSEFSSVLMRKYAKQFNVKDWVSHHDANFEYGNGGVDAVKRGEIGRFFDEQIVDAGFLSLYSQSSLENDFNAVAGYLWLGEARLWDTASRSERIHGKMEVAIDFYRHLAPALDARFFKALVATPQEGEDPG